jgi:hypothetical membrane protein
METTGTITHRTNTGEQTSIKLTKALLACGIATGPLFYILALIQMPLRSGFDIRRHAISLLSLGDLGWIQIASFIVTGLLALLCAVGMRRLLRSSQGGTWGPILIGIYGVGLILGGIFHPDPGLGFPAGAPAGMPASMSPHATVHTLGFFTAFLSLIVACFVFARRFASLGQRRWAIYCAVSGVVATLLIFLGTSNPSLVGVIIAFAGVIAFGWVSVIAAKLRTELHEA